MGGHREELQDPDKVDNFLNLVKLAGMHVLPKGYTRQNPGANHGDAGAMEQVGSNRSRSVRSLGSLL